MLPRCFPGTEILVYVGLYAIFYGIICALRGERAPQFGAWLLRKSPDGSVPGVLALRAAPTTSAIVPRTGCPTGVVAEHLESFYQALGEQGTSLPAFVYAELER